MWRPYLLTLTSLIFPVETDKVGLIKIKCSYPIKIKLVIWLKENWSVITPLNKIKYY